MKSEWSSRLLLEALAHPAADFVTLTYNKEHLPDADKFEGGNLSPRDLQLFLKRLRKSLPHPVRFFAVGEYGSRHGRAHYHLVIYGRSNLSVSTIEAAWSLDNQPLGFVTTRPAELKAFNYVSGYVVKKFIQASPEGRTKMFIRTSRRPGLGVPSVTALASLVGQDNLQFGDVPGSWVFQGKQRPLGRLCKERLREAFFPDRDVREGTHANAIHTRNLALHLALRFSQEEIDRMLVDSEKALQALPRQLLESDMKERI